MSSPRTNPMTWWLVQIVEYLTIVFVLGRIIPASTSRWLQVAVFVLAIAGVFLLNYYVVMPKIGSSSHSSRRGG